MMNVLNRMRFKRVRSRFLAAMILLSLPLIVLLGLISINITNDALIDVNEKSNKDQLKTSSEVADLLFGNINNLHWSLVNNNEIRDELRSNGQNPDIRPDIQTLRTSTRLQRMVSSSHADTRYVKSICIFDLQFRTYCSGRSDDAGVFEGEDKITRIKESQWYMNAYKNKGKIEYLPADLFGESDEAFSTVKLFRDADHNGVPIGIMVINVSKSIFNKVFNSSGSEYGAYMALDHLDGSPTAVYNSSFDVPLGKGGMNEVLGQLEKQGYFINSFYNQTSKWTLVHLVQKKELLGEAKNLRWVTTLIAAAFALFAIAVSYIISGTITRSLLQVKKMMLDWTKGVKEFPEVFAQDEVGVIGNTFRRIAVEYDELNEKLVHSELKEKEAELRALQSQIKPHFLYNTLDSMYWMAYLEKNYRVAEMAVSLSESFKLSLNKGKETMPVYNELKHIQHYMKIQNIRFNDRFSYMEDVDDAILGMEMLKLLLQPLVENSIYHGLERKIGKGTIRLTGRKVGHYLVFTVEDDGVGMEDVNQTEHGYGLKNVRERLQLYYGPDSSMNMWSAKGVGTKVTLKFNPLPPKETGTNT
ncbi:histidine kinase [Paenibacillus sp. LHD-117]|uniref:sensor histidine kinase n=1 Tax=Paenibacillus sp. LHD-117 TaxID=3071412 RepID=UPI0027DF7D86|nr:histidine kinase [Paenibacillus sp. LHD-117]MDQ6417942.1 histidine kinase [Paenibacillus sp. LHD-117]